jgi:hypothetical protein
VKTQVILKKNSNYERLKKEGEKVQKNNKV